MSWIPILGPILDKILERIPDPNERARERARLEAEIEKGMQAAQQGQIDINKIEAAHNNIFVAGWRPFIGWTLGLAIFAKFIAVPLLTWASTVYGIPAPPELELGELITLIGGMLGMSTLRGWEKTKK